MIELIRKKEDYRSDKITIVNQVKAMAPHLFRRNSVRFNGNENFDKIVTGMLHGAGFFERDKNGLWAVNDEKAKEWEERQMN